MANLFLILLLTLCADNIFVDMIMLYPRKCSNVESKSTTLRLKRHLLCEYDSDVRPVQNNNNVTRVKLYMMPKFLEYKHETEIFSLHTWTAMSWNDSHLTWDPKQFDDIQSILVSIYEIWVPDILLHNQKISVEGTMSTTFTQENCWISKHGRVHWITPAKYSIFCTPDNTWWPYNIMNCTMQFGSWSHSGDEIELVSNQYPPIITDLPNYKKNMEWDLLKIDITKREVEHKYNSDSTATLLSYHFILRRHWGIIRIAYVTPTIVLMIMTLTALWLEPKSFERMVIANLNFICHILCIQDVHWEMPKSGFNTPKLLIFYERSLAMASFTLILTNILRQLQELTTEPPAWISGTTKSILRSRVGRILLISILDPASTAKIEVDADDNTDLVQSNSKKSPWRYVTVLVGWLAFSSILLAYIVLLSTCFPYYYTVIL